MFVATVVEERKATEQQRAPNRTEEFAVRCMVYPEGDEYIAERIDLDLIAGGKSRREALQSLFDSISSYLQTVQEGDPTGLLPRPSPFSHRIRYRLYALAAAVSKANHRRFLVADYPPGVRVCP